MSHRAQSPTAQGKANGHTVQSHWAESPKANGHSAQISLKDNSYLNTYPPAARKESEMTPQIRCDSHIGDAWPTRCPACESLQAEYAQLKIGATR